jgi:ELWxxDGT repeat protein
MMMNWSISAMSSAIRTPILRAAILLLTALLSGITASHNQPALGARMVWAHSAQAAVSTLYLPLARYTACSPPPGASYEGVRKKKHEILRPLQCPFVCLDVAWGLERTSIQQHRIRKLEVHYAYQTPAPQTDPCSLTTQLSRRTGGRGYELWQSNGSLAGTLRVSANGPQTAAGDIWFLQDVNGTLFALVDQSQQSTALWSSDGTAAGTRRIKDFAPGTSASNYTALPTMANVNGKLVFALYPAAQPPGTRSGAIWSSDGTTAGTIPIKEQLSHTLSAAVTCGTLYFSAKATDSAGQGDELWQSDGTAAGTFQVQDIAPGSADSRPLHLTAVAHQLFFSADVATSGRELWALPIAHTATVGPTPSIPLPHQIFLPHTQIDASC